MSRDACEGELILYCSYQIPRFFSFFSCTLFLGYEYSQRKMEKERKDIKNATSSTGGLIVYLINVSEYLYDSYL
jgi:hypothetical protein